MVSGVSTSSLKLRDEIEALYADRLLDSDRAAALRVFEEFRALLNRGEVRAATKVGDRWEVNSWVKKGILIGFRLGVLQDVSIDGRFKFFDKSTFPLKNLSVENEVRLVPGGSTIRDGAYVARGVVCMPPMFINIGAFVDEGTMVDSHALVGSCAQVGKNVHLSAGAQLGGVLEPVGALPVIIEDDVLVGGNCGIYEGAVVKRGAILAAGVILTGGTAVFDVEKQKIYRKEGNNPLTIPERAVVVPGARMLENIWARDHQLSVATPVIIKYRDEKTDRSALLEEILR